MNIKWDIIISALLSGLILSPCLGSDLPAIVESMGNKHECEQYPTEIHWISEKTSALVIGKSEDSVRVCRLKFGLATIKEGARVRLSFDFLYNHACGVYLQINESVTSDFSNSTSNREMLMSRCNTSNPGLLFAQPKSFVLISLVKENERIGAYNFRLNISMAERLPSRGPELHVVIIVGFVLSVVVALSAILLYKYIVRLTYRWHEQQLDEGMTRAINIYTSQEHIPEPDSVRSRPGGTKGRAVEPVFSNGRVERFRSPDGPSAEKRDLISRKADPVTSQAGLRFQDPLAHQLIGPKEPSVSFQPASSDLQSDAASPLVATDFGDTASLGGFDIPPSYEEALGMPLATDVDKDMDEDGMDIAVGGRLELDYFHEDTSVPGLGRGGKGSKRHGGGDTFT